jgi:NTE family protein
MEPEPSPHHDWARHALRVNSLIDDQVRSLRKRQVVSGFITADRRGTYLGIRSHVADFGPPDGGLPCPDASTLELARIKTRLKAMDGGMQGRLMNWGYAICDTAMRTWVERSAAAPGGFPYPASGVA